MEIISFDLCGKTAHFRKYYSSSTALSHTIPPKTTITGIVAAMLGLERDSYYDLFNQWLFGIQIMNPIRKIFHKQNYLKVEDNINFDKNEVTGNSKRTQISVELVIPEIIREDEIRYRIYIANPDKTDKYFKKLKMFLENELSVFGCSLGTANYIGYCENYVNQHAFEKIETEQVLLSSAAISDNVQLLENPDETTVIEQDTFPMHFKVKEKKKASDFNIRIADEVKSLIYPVTTSGMRVQILENNNFIHLKDKNINIQLL